MWRSACAALLLSLVVVSCSKSDSGATALAERRKPVPEPALDHVPQRILPASTAAFEFLVTLVEPARLVALPRQVDEYSNVDVQHGALATIPRYPRFVAESVLACQPDLVVAMAWQGGDTTQALRSRGVSVLLVESGVTYADIRNSLRDLGEVLGVSERAQAEIEALDKRVAALRERTRAWHGLRALSYTNDGTGGWAAGADTTIQTVFELVGVENAAARDGLREHQALDFERLLRIDPDLFVISIHTRGDGGSPTEEVLKGAKVLTNLRALRERRIAYLPANLFSADSPKTVEAAEALAAELERLGPFGEPQAR